MTKDGIWPEIIVGVARGGWVPARILCDLFAKYYDFSEGNDKKVDLTNLEVIHPHLLNVGMRRYTPGKIEETKDAEWFQPIEGRARDDILGRVTLVVDDVFDVGESLRLVLKNIAKAKPKKLYAAVLDVKKEPFEPDEAMRKIKMAMRKKAEKRIREKTSGLYFAEKMERDDWILYPWETLEETLALFKKTGDLKEVQKSMRGHGVPISIKKLIYKKIGYAKEGKLGEKFE